MSYKNVSLGLRPRGKKHILEVNEENISTEESNVTGIWRNKLHNMYSAAYIRRMIKSRKMRINLKKQGMRM